MNQLYARVFTQILDSSLAEDWQARHVFEDLLKLADGGLIDMTRQAISRRTNVPLDVIEKAINVLESPDPASRDAAEDGRRIVRLDAHRDWGWLIVNWDKYERIKKTLDQRDKTADRVRRHRDRKAVSPAPLPKEAEANSEAEAEAEEALPKRNAPLHAVTSQVIEKPKRSAVASPTSTQSDEQWLLGLKSGPAYQGIDVQCEHAKMVHWCGVKRKQPTRARFINWLNRVEKPMTATTTTAPKLATHTKTEITDPSKL